MTNSNVIFSYTRAQAVTDCVLIDVTDEARREGYLVPVALTSGAWSECVLPSDGLATEGTGSDGGRLAAVLQALRLAIMTTGGWKEELGFTVLVRRREGDGMTPYRLKAVCGPDDDARPCVTIMLPCED